MLYLAHNYRGKNVTNVHRSSQLVAAKHTSRGFALPTILIASIVMLLVLLASVTSTTAVRTAMKDQYYVQLAQVAGEAGVAYAQACLDANARVPSWSAAKPLTSSTDCSGNPLSGLTCPGVDSRCSVTKNGNIRSNFSIGDVPVDGDGQATTVSNTGYVEVLRTSNDAVWRRYNQKSAPTAVVPDLCSGTATTVQGWNAAVLSVPQVGITFPETSARQISNVEGSSLVGSIYFRRDFSVLVSGMYVLNHIGDDNSEIFVDGAPVSSAGWSTVTTNVNLAVGCHTVIAKVTNSGILANPARFVFSLKLIGDSVPLVVSDRRWRVASGNSNVYSNVNFYPDPTKFTPIRDIVAATGDPDWTPVSGDTLARSISTAHSYDGSGWYPAASYMIYRDNRDVTVTAATTVRVSYACDDSCSVFLDGNELAATNNIIRIRSFETTLTEGKHKFSVFLYNTTGPSSFVFAAVRTADGVVLSRSDPSWSAASTWSATDIGKSVSSYDNSYVPNPIPTPIVQCPTAMPVTSCAANRYQAAVVGSGPLAYWPMNEATGASVATALVGGINGTYNGIVSLAQPGPLASANGRSVLFGGTGTVDKVTMPVNAVWNRTNGQAFSVEAWIKPNWTSGYRDIVVNRGTGGTYNWILYQHTADGSLQLHGAAQNKSSYVPANGVWSHVVATVDTSNVSRLYVNGTLVQTVSGFTYGASPGSVIHIGNGPNDVNEPFGGSISDTALYTKTLTPAEVTAHYAARLLP